MNRRKTLAILVALCLSAPVAGFLAFDGPARATRIGRKPVEPLVREADAIIVAEILDVTVTDNRIGGKLCTSTTTMTLAARDFIRGHLPEGAQLTFRYKQLNDDREPCLRLYEVHAPRARLRKTGARTGVKLIATVVSKTLANGETDFEVTSTHDMEAMERIKAIAGK